MNLIDLKNIELTYKYKKREHRVLDGINISLSEGEILGLVGESGCGKTTLGRIIIGLEKNYTGEYYYRGNLQNKSDKNEEHIRKKDIQMIFQDPYMSIDPMMNMYDVIEEPLRSLRKDLSKEEIQNRVYEVMDWVGLDRSYLNKKSSSLSGGQLQRIGIARALACEPSILICDEPVSALDVSVQAQILNLMKRIKADLNVSMIFISHDIGVVRYLADTIAVMLEGKICEIKKCDNLFKEPIHPYVKRILDSTPKIK